MGGGALASGIGNGIIFFMSMIAAIIIGLYTAAYAAHILLAVIDATAGGADEVTWPDEPVVDWLWKFAYLLWMVAIWLIPLGLVSRWLLDTRPAAQAMPGILTTAAILFWLLFPISLLSSMSATSHWVIFSPAVLPRMASRAGSVVIFFLLTGPLLAVGALALFGLVFAGPPVIAPVEALVLTAVLLIYARLFGRLALQLRLAGDQDRPARPTKRRPAVQAQAAERVARSAPQGGDVIRAGDLPPVNAPDEEARTGYDVLLTDAGAPTPAPAARRRPVDEEGPGQYGLADGAPDVPPPRQQLPETLLNPSEYERKLAGLGRRGKVPDHPWTSNTWTFPLAAINRGPIVWMTLGFAVAGSMCRLMTSFTPGG
jgi:hypothetical protein